MIRNLLLATAAIAVATSAATAAAPRKALESTTLPASNPFAKPSTLPFETPDFSKIKDSDYLPALLAGMAQQKAEVTAIANQKARADFDNTVVAMESRAYCSSARPRVQRRQRREHQRHAAGDRHQDRAAVRRAQRLHLSRTRSSSAVQVPARSPGRTEPEPRAGEAARRLLQAVRACGRGASSGEAGPTQDHQQEAEHALDASSAKSCLPQPRPARSTSPTKRRSLDFRTIRSPRRGSREGPQARGYVLPLQNTTQQPRSESLTNHDTRQKLFEAEPQPRRTSRRERHPSGGASELAAAACAEGGAVRRHANFADYTLYDQMAKNRATAVGFLDRLAPAISAKERDGVGRTSSAWRSRRVQTFQPTPRPDWNYYAEQIRKQRYALNNDDTEAVLRVQQGAGAPESSMLPISFTG